MTTHCHHHPGWLCGLKVLALLAALGIATTVGFVIGWQMRGFHIQIPTTPDAGDLTTASEEATANASAPAAAITLPVMLCHPLGAAGDGSTFSSLETTLLTLVSFLTFFISICLFKPSVPELLRFRLAQMTGGGKAGAVGESGIRLDRSTTLHVMDPPTPPVGRKGTPLVV